MKKRPLFLAALLSSAAASPVGAAIVYWDANAGDPGAGFTPGGAWTSALWSTDVDGLAPTAAWVAGDTAIFSAGTDATGPYTVSGNATTGGITVEEGALTLSGTITLGVGPVNVGPGASINTNSSLRVSTTAGSVWTLDGGTAISTNGAAAGSFIDIDSTISLAAGGGTLSHTAAGILNIVQTTTVISGPGSLTKNGAGVLAIASASTYGGSTTVNDGELRIRTSADRLPVTTAVTVNSPGILNLNNVAQRIGSLTGTGTVGLGNATITISGSTSLSFDGTITDIANAGASGSISRVGKVTKSGAGTQTFAGANTYTGVTTISGGTLKAGHASALGYGGLQTTATGITTVGSGFTLDLNGTNTVNEPITLNGTGIGGNGALVNNAGTAATIGSGIAGIQFAGISSGSGYSTVPVVVITGAGSGATATATLGVTAASFSINGGTTVYSAAPTVAISGGGGSGAAATATLTGGVVSGITITNAGAGFSGTPAIAFSGGTVTAAGANPTGSGIPSQLAVSGLTMTAAGSGYNGASAYTFSDGDAVPGTVTHSSVVLASNSSIGGTGDTIINAIVSESGGARSLTKVGAGTLTLAGTNTYTGATSVTAGTLLVEGSLNAASSVSVTGTLAGGGTVGGAVTVASGGTVAPGASVGTLNFGSTLDIQSGSFYNVEITGAAAADKVNVTGALTANGTIKVTLSGYVPVAGNTFDIADAASITGTPTFDFSSAVLTAGLTWDTSLFGSTGVIKVSVPGSDPYVAWAASYGLTGGKTDDDDKDGSSNLLEFATNSNPKTVGDGARTYGKLHLLGGDRVLTLTVATRSGASFSGAVRQTATKDNVIYTVEGSDDLTAWNSVVITQLNPADSAAVQASLSLPTLDAGWEWHTFRTDGGASTDPRDFIRLSVAPQP